MTVYQVEIKESGRSVKFYGQVVAKSGLAAINQIETLLLRFQPNREFVVQQIRLALSGERTQF
jgi:hypothetical protein